MPGQITVAITVTVFLFFCGNNLKVKEEQCILDTHALCMSQAHFE